MKEAVTTGVSEEFSERTGVTVTASAGIEIKGFSAVVEGDGGWGVGGSVSWGVVGLCENGFAVSVVA